MKLIQFNNKPLLIDSKKEPKTPEDAIEIYSEYLKRDVFNAGLLYGFLIGMVLSVFTLITLVKIISTQ